ncbi:MAG: 3-keto-5-aminohexanoate cleavage protein, partial [bacterium]
MNKVIITCAIIGAAPTRDQNPDIPITPEEIADSAIEACHAGAS